MKYLYLQYIVLFCISNNNVEFLIFDDITYKLVIDNQY